MGTTSSVGSDIFSITSLLVIALLVLLLIRHFLPLRSTPAYLLIPVFLALALPCSIIVLVPIDLASTDDDENTHSRGVWLPPNVVLVTWRITYWLIFVLTWFVLPLLGEFCDSGYRDVRSRAIYSLRVNAKYQLIGGAIGIAGLVYFIFENGFHAASIKGLVMALAYTYGLILAIGLMGHGLVALPKRLYKNAFVSQRLRLLQTSAPKAKDRLDESAEELDKLEQTVIQLKRHKGGASREQQVWIDEIADTVYLSDARPGYAAAIQAANTNIPGVVTDRYLADLTRKLKRARHRKARFVDEWSHLCQRAQDTQAIIDAAASRKLDFAARPSDRSLMSRINFLTPTMRFYLHMYAVPSLRISLAVFFGLASVMVVWSEVIKPIAPKLSIIGLTIVHYPDSNPGGKVGFASQLIAAAWLLYMDTSTLYAISDVKVWGNRALVKRQTYAESACWYSLQVAKLTVPLSYNFITLLPKTVFQDTSFYRFLGQLIDLTPIGKGFNTFFPCILLIPVVATLFNLYGKAKGVFGFGVLEDDSEENPSGFGTGGWREGRALIERELQSQDSEGSLLGLPTRGPSLDLEQGRRSSALPPRQERVDPIDASEPNSNVRESNRQFRTVTNQDEPEDNSPRHFYQDFTERVRNTFDTVDRPEWTKNLGNVFKAPRWMQSNPQDTNGDASGLGRWFGGRPEDGRLRL